VRADERAAGPTRTCVGCGRRDRQSAMLRLRADADSRIACAKTVRTGRSAYVHAARDCVRGLVRSKVLGKSLRRQIAKDTRAALVASLEGKLAAGVDAADRSSGY
jgi:predicted RNA-binding protein YlxR (DUF448 family)